MNVSDYVIQFIERRHVRDVFLLSGGGIMYLLDALTRTDVAYYCNRHEQACAISAEGYARATNRPGVCMVTTGPGATNAASGILGAWADSLPLLVVSGQVKRELMADFAHLRQKGPQEGNAIDAVAPITKYAVSVGAASRIRFELEKAWHIATSGRPGPVWVEIPLDVQAEEVDPSALQGFAPPPSSGSQPGIKQSQLERVVAALRGAERPLILAGAGVHLAAAEEVLRGFVNTYGLPVIMPDSGKDLLHEDHPLTVGVFGPAAQRRANFAVQTCDCLLVLGASLCAKKIGFAYADFARLATKVVVDIDEEQLTHQVIRPDVGVCCDVKEFLEVLGDRLRSDPLPGHRLWLEALAEWKESYPLVTNEHYARRDYVDCYAFMDALSSAMAADDVLVTGNGLDSVSYVQAFKVKQGQRTILNSNWGAMGWDLPLAIGVCVGSGRRTVCVTGDGSVQLNLQELMTISHYQLPISIFIFNNAGYATIRATQRNLFEGRLVASDRDTGVDDPEFGRLAEAFGLGYSRLSSTDGLRDAVAAELARKGPRVCEVMVSPDQEILPRSMASRRDDGSLVSRPLEDMTPLLPRDEIWRNMHRFDKDA